MLFEIIYDQDIQTIFKALNQEARLVGGCVRDSLLKKDINDVDIATPLPPDEVIKLLKKSNIKNIPTGLKHGTITAVINKRNFEITTLRRDKNCDGRHAEVEFTNSWQEDAARRDFTINAMSISFDSKLHDYFGGQSDLKNKIVRFVGDPKKRCEEDTLRILRFFRFNSFYGSNTPHKASLNACVQYANQIKNLSGERIQSEMVKILSSENTADTLDLMIENNILDDILPNEVDLDIKSLRRLLNIEKNIMISSKPSPILRLASIILENKEEKIKAISKRWKLSRKDHKYLLTIAEEIKNQDFNIRFSNEKNEKKAIRRLGKDMAFDLCILSYSVYGDEKQKEEYKNLYKKINSWDIPIFPVSGKDLINLGIKEGEKIGLLLSDAENWWEENNYEASSDEIIEHIITLINKS